MKTKSFIIIGVGASFLMFGLYVVAVYPGGTEYQTPPAAPYVDGATPPHIETWDMY